MKKKPTKRIKKPKTKYAVNRKPKAEFTKFGQWVSKHKFIHNGGDFNTMNLAFLWQAWQAALPRIRQ